MDDVVNRLEMIFCDKTYIQNIKNSKKNWIGISIDDILKEDLSYFKSLL